MRRKQGGGLSSTFEIPEVCQVESPPTARPAPLTPRCLPHSGARDASPQAANQPHTLLQRGACILGGDVSSKDRSVKIACVPLCLWLFVGLMVVLVPGTDQLCLLHRLQEGRPSVGGGEVSLLGKAPLAGLLEMPAHLVTSRRRHSKHSVSRFPVLVLKQAVPIYLSSRVHLPSWPTH